MNSGKKYMRKTVRLSEETYNFIRSFGNENDNFSLALHKMMIVTEGFKNKHFYGMPYPKKEDFINML